jgi:signal transduction histidine kinase
VLAKADFDGKTVTISIADDGPGIAEADRQLALRAGGRLDRERPGTGLGLTIASETAEDYGGSMALVTSAELGGLEARLTLPGRSRRKERSG